MSFILGCCLSLRVNSHLFPRIITEKIETLHFKSIMTQTQIDATRKQEKAEPWHDKVADEKIKGHKSCRPASESTSGLMINS
jgi:hypothetical protein